MTSKIETALLSREHLAAVAELERLGFAEPWSEQALKLLLSDAAFGVVALQNGTPAAYAGAMIAADEGQITNVCTHPNARRMGFGRAALEALECEARARGLLQLSLEVRVSGNAAIALYQSRGFEIAGVRKRFYRHPTEDAYVMLKALT